MASYGTTGFGVIHAWVEGPGDQYDVEQDDLAFNVGGGVMYSLNGRVGLRGDLRYFRAFVDEDKREGGYFKDYGFLRDVRGHIQLPAVIESAEHGVAIEKGAWKQQVEADCVSEHPSRTNDQRRKAATLLQWCSQETDAPLP